MKAADNLKNRLGANMRESMGTIRPADGDSAAAAPPPRAASGQYDGCARVKDAFAIELDRIIPDPEQPRKEFDEAELADLAGSLKERGQLQPIRVRWSGDLGKWVIIVGERRYRAARLAGLPTVLCIEARAAASDDEVLEDQLIENLLRSDLKPVEQARGFRILMERRGYSQRDLARKLHIAQATVAKAVRLLDLPEPVLEMVDRQEQPLAPSIAYDLTKIPDPETQTRVAEQVIAESLNREQAAEVVKRTAKAATSKGRGGKAQPKKVTEKTIRVAGGKVTLENRRGLDDATSEAMLREALAQVVTSAAADAA